MYRIDLEMLLDSDKKFEGRVCEMPTDGLTKKVLTVARHFAGVLSSCTNYILLEMFTCFGECLGKKVKLYHNAYDNKANLYSLLVGDSGDTKSPSMNLVMNYLNRVDHKKEEAFERLHDSEIESEKKIPSLFDEQMIAENCTIEKLYNILYATKKNCKTGVLLSLDEATTFFSPGATLKSKTGAVVPHILSMFSAPYLKVDRLYLGKPLYIEDPMLSILAGTQYDNLGGMFNGFKGCGFSSRWLFGLPNEETPRIKKDSSIVQEWEDCQEIAIDHPGLSLTFANEAQADEIQAALKTCTNELRKLDGEMASYVIKQNFYVHRFAVIVHCLNALMERVAPTATIDEYELDYAFRLSQFFMSNAHICLEMMSKQATTSLTGKQLLKLLNDRWKVTNFSALSEATGGALDRGDASKCINGKL